MTMPADIREAIERQLRSYRDAKGDWTKEALDSILEIFAAAHVAAQAEALSPGSLHDSRNPNPVLAVQPTPPVAPASAARDIREVADAANPVAALWPAHMQRVPVAPKPGEHK